MKKDYVKVAADLQKSAGMTRVFLSMPYISGITPACMEREDLRRIDEACGLQRRDGFFAVNEAFLSPLDHGNLYGDAVFEGIRIDRRRILLLKEHVDRWMNSAKRLDIEFPYNRRELCEILIELTRQALAAGGISGYLRPVLTRGMGNLGVNPQKCVSPTLYIICSSIALYPPERYENGIDVAIARNIRRNDARHLDPNIKTNNYLNNVMALLETSQTGAIETLMLTNDGYVAEATADNIFIAQEIGGHKRLTVPASRYALRGLTRALVIHCARELGFEIVESDALLPTDFIGESREVFITGTACGLMPVATIDGLACARPGCRPLLGLLREAIAEKSGEDGISMSIDAGSGALESYLGDRTFPVV